MILICGMLCIATLNAQTWNIGSPNAEDVTATLSGTGNNRTLTISGNGLMKNFWYSIHNAAPWIDSYQNSITHVEIEEGVTNIGDLAFWGTALTSIVIPNSVTTIGQEAFVGCIGLTSVTIPNFVTTIGELAFAGCTGLTSITIPNLVETIGMGAFAGCSNLVAIHVNQNNISFSSVDGILFDKAQTVFLIYPQGMTANSYEIPNTVETIGDGAFRGCSGLTSIVIPNSVKTIGDEAFAGCSGLTSIVIPNSVKTIGDEAFAGCSGLTSIVIPNSVKTIGNRAFTGCNSLMALSIGNSVKTIGEYAFSGCSDLTSIVIPNSVISIGNFAFQNCSDLAMLTIGSSVNTIGNFAFQNCSSLNKLTIGSSVNSIGWGAFENCSKLTEVIIPNSVISIGNGVFAYCTELNSITIPNSVTSFGLSTFYGCTSLTEFINHAVTPQTIDANFFNGVNFSQATLRVPAGSVAAYAANDFWGEFTSIVAIHTAVTDVTTVPSTATATMPLTLSGTVVPEDATNKNIVWSVHDTGDTGATINGNTLNTTAAGTVTVRATITNGATETTNYTQDFNITVSLANLTGDVSISVVIDVVFGETLTATITGLSSDPEILSLGALSYQWRRGETDISGATSHTYTLTQADIGSQINLVVSAANCSGSVTSEYTQTVAKAHQYAPVQPTMLGSTATSITLNTVQGCEYSLIGGEWQSSPVFTDLTPGTYYAFIQRFIETDTHSASQQSEPASFSTEMLVTKTVSISSQNGIIFSVIAGSATFDVTTANISNGQAGDIEWFSDAAGTTSTNAPTGISASVSNVSNNAAEVTIETSSQALHGTYWFRVVIDGAQSEVAVLTISPSWQIGAPNEEDVIATLNDGTLTISGTGAMPDYLSFESPWHNIRSYITTVIIGDGVTNIGNNAFLLCSNLIEVTIPNSVTSIGDWAFNGCENLTEVTIPNFVTSIGEYAFFSCSNLTDIIIPNSVKTIGDLAFSHCTDLEEIIIPYSVKTIGNGAFSNCYGLTTVMISNSVKTIGGFAFSGCINLEEITIPSSVTSIGPGIFSSCSSLTEIKVEESSKNFSSVDGVLFNKNQTTLIQYPPGSEQDGYIIPNSVISIEESAFQSCFNLEKVTIPSSVTSIGDFAFRNSGLTVITNYASVPQDISSADVFRSLAISEITLRVPACFLDAYLTADVWKEFGTKAQIETKVGGDLTETMTWSLYEDGTLIICGTGNMPDYNYGDAPWYNIRNSINTVIIGDGVTSIGSLAFYDCISFTSISIPNSVTSIGWQAFVRCFSLTSITIPNSVTSIDDDVFWGTGLTSITVATDNTNYCSIDGVLFNKDATILIQYPESKQGAAYTIPNSVKSLGNSAFRACIGLTSITIPNSVTDIGWQAFRGCTGLTSITIPNSVTSIGSWAFYGCTGLNSITIPSSVTSIGILAFFGCTGITSVTIPNSVTSIGQTAFRDCTGLTEFINHAVSPQGIQTNVFENVDLSKATLHVPAGSVTTYQNAAVWKDFGAISALPISISIAAQNGILTAGVSGSATFDVSTANIANGQAGTVQWFSDAAGATSANAPTGISASVSNMLDNAAIVTITATTETVQGEYWFRVTIDGLQTEIATLTVAPLLTWHIGAPNEEDVIATLIAGTLTISGTGDMQNFEWNTMPWYDIRASINTVIIEQGITNIGNNAFSRSAGLTSISIPNSVTSIGNYAFLGCTGIISITIPNSVTSIGDQAFYGCTGITSITIPNSVTSIGGQAFYGCTGLTSITIPNSVTSIGNYAFLGCTSITSINADTDNPNYSSIEGVLFNKNETILIQYPAGKHGEYIIPNSVTSIGECAFWGCTGITSITITNRVTSIGSYAFLGCTGLTSVTIPNSVTSIGREAFFGCTGLTEFFNHSISPQISEGMFANVDLSQATLRVPACFLDAYLTADVWKEFGTKEAIETKVGGNVTTMTWSLYEDGTLIICGTGDMPDWEWEDTPWYDVRASITTVIIGNGVSTIGRYAFYYCTNLTSITIPNSVTSIGDGAFSGCTGLTSITIPNSVTSIGNSAFWTCRSLTSITIPNSVTSIGMQAFYNCTGLTSIDVAADNPNYSSNNGVLFDKDKTILIQYPASKQDATYTIPNSVTIIGGAAFRYCTGLTSITIPNSVTIINSSAFWDCTGLISIDVVADNPNFSSIDGVLFNKNKTNLMQYPAGKQGAYTIPNSVTSIDDSALRGCTGLTTITIPNSVTSISRSAFLGCTGLTEFINHSVIPQDIHEYVFWNVSLSQVTLRIPAGSVSAYETAEVWKDFGAITALPISIGTQNGVIGAGIGGFATFDVTTDNIANGQAGTIQWFSNAAGTISTDVPAGISASVSNVSDNAATVTITATTETEQGEYWFRVTIDGLQTEIATLTVAPLLTWHIGYPNTEDVIATLIAGTLTISGEGAMLDFNSEGSPWYGRRNLINAVIIEQGITNIGDDAFRFCTGLTTITIPNSVTSIGINALIGCTGLTSIIIPNSVTSIRGAAFWGCSALTEFINYAITPQTINENVFLYVDLSQATLHVPAASIDAYEGADVWKDFKIVALPVVLSDDASLQSISVSSGSLSPAFSHNITGYTVHVIESAITVTGVANHGGATVSGNVEDMPLTIGENTVTITVTAEDGVSQMTYTIIVHREILTGCEINVTIVQPSNGTITVMDGSTPVVSGASFNVNDNKTLTLTATPSEGYQFDSWWDGNADAERTVDLSHIHCPDIITISATFTVAGAFNLPAGIVEVAYSQTLEAVSEFPVTWALVGSLPAGLSLAPATGVISGTPSAAGTFEFSVMVTIGNYYTIVDFSIFIDKGVGAALTAVPTLQSATTNSITVNPVPAPPNGQSVEYAIVQNIPNASRIQAWQSGTTFTSLSSNSLYYIFARAAESNNFYAGETTVSSHLITNFVTSSGALEHVRPLRAWIHNELLRVSGLTEGETVSIFSITGALVYQTIATGEEMEIPLQTQGVYVIQSGENTVRVVFN